MPLSNNSPVRVEASGHDVRYFLPARPLGLARWFGLIPIAFGLIFISIPIKSILGFLPRIANGSLFDLVFVLFLSLFVMAGLAPISFGVFAIFGRARVEWSRGRLSVLEYIGPIRWRRRLSSEGDSIRKLAVTFGAPRKDKPMPTGPLAALAALKVDFEKGKSRMVVLGYPKDWLEGLATDLSSRLGASVSSGPVPKVELQELSSDAVEIKDVVERPAGSNVRLEKDSGNLRMTVPPMGLAKGSRGLFAFGMAWCLFMTVFTTIMLFAKGDGTHDDAPWFVWIFVGGFWVIGLSMLAGAINMGRRRAMILAGNGELRVAEESLFGKKLATWPRDTIAAIRADASGMSVNDVPILELQVHPVTGRKSGFFAGRDEEELRWIATELRRALQVPAKNEDREKTTEPIGN